MFPSEFISKKKRKREGNKLSTFVIRIRNQKQFSLKILMLDVTEKDSALNYW